MNTEISKPEVGDSKAGLHVAIAQEVVWKNAEMRRFAVELVARAVQVGEGDMGQRGSTALPGFTTDIVPDAARGSGPGIAGSVVELLKTANVIEPVGIWSGGKWYPERLKSTRAGCKSRYLCVHRLKSRALAQAFLRRNAAEVQPVGRYMDQELVKV